jgi:ubiquinone/menaquinone biosynthesis C-methylase UbiE
MEILKRNLNTERTKKDYKQVAWFYNLWSWITESKAAKKVLEFAEINNGESIIEIACGTGLVFKEIVRKNPDGENLGIDLSAVMLSKAHKLLADEDSKNYELQQRDIFDLQIKDESYDKLVNNFMIDLMPEDKFDTILSEFHRILKPNGIAVISIFSFGKRKVNKFWVWIAKHFPKLLTGCRPVEIENNLKNVGFMIEKEVEISQNTFPSKVYKLRKPAANI